MQSAMARLLVNFSHIWLESFREWLLRIHFFCQPPSHVFASFAANLLKKQRNKQQNNLLLNFFLFIVIKSVLISLTAYHPVTTDLCQLVNSMKTISHFIRLLSCLHWLFVRLGFGNRERRMSIEIVLYLYFLNILGKYMYTLLVTFFNCKNKILFKSLTILI